MPVALRPRPALLALALCAAAVSPPRAHADPPRAHPSPLHRRHLVDSAARRDSDLQRHHRSYERTLDPVTRHGRPIRVTLATRPVAFGPAPAPAAPTADAARPYDHVVIVSLDGLRPDAIEMTDAPNLRLLRAQGAFATEARTITHSYTLPSHTSMLTGVDTDRHGMLHNNFVPSRGFVRVPTAFYFAHDAGLETAMFVSKPKLRHLAVPGSVDVFERPDYVCEPVVAAAAAHLARVGAGLTFVHLSEPDEFGHSRGWMTEAYLQAVARADRCVGSLLTALGRRADLDRVLVIVSADHGGHGRTHGSTRDEDMRIPWIAWGSRVARGDFATPVSTMDTAATALAALGVPLPASLVGRPVRIALDGPRPTRPTPGRTPRPLPESAAAPATSPAPAPIVSSRVSVVSAPPVVRAAATTPAGP